MKVLFAYLHRKCVYPVFGQVDLDMEGPAGVPLGLSCVKAYAASDVKIAAGTTMLSRSFGHALSAEDIALLIAAEKPDAAAFSCHLANIAKTMEVSRLLKRMLPGVAIVAGGAAVPKVPARVLKFMKERPELDAAVFGEGEVPFSRWLKNRLDGKSQKALPGLAVRAGARALVGARADLPDLGKMPSPYLDGGVKLNVRSTGFVCLETSRGCPFSCAYCAADAAQKSLRFFPLERLRRELAWLKKSGFYGTIFVTDPIVNLRKDRAAEVFGLFAGSRSAVVMDVKPELLDDELIALLGAIPRLNLEIGIQSSNPEALRNMGRSSDLARCAGVIRKLLAHKNISVRLQLILGLPGDNYGTFKKTLDWALGFGKGPVVNVTDLVVLENSRLARLAAKFSIRTDREGLVLSNSSFSAAGLLRASRCLAAYHAVRADNDALRKFGSACAAGAKPSALLEKLALELAKAGHLGRKRVLISRDGPAGKIPKGFLEKALG